MRGIVTDTTGQPLGNVRVVLTSGQSGFVYDTRTPRRGVFELTFLPPGEYDVVAERLGWLPVEIRGVRLVPGGDVQLEIRLQTVEPPVLERAVRRADPAALDRAEGSGAWDIGAFELRRLADHQRDLVSAARYAPTVAGGLSIEGLPADLSQISVDGIPFRFARHPVLGREDADASALPSLAFQSALIDGGGLDVEWTGFAGGRLAGQGVRGSNRFETRLSADWAPATLSSSKYFDAQGLSGHSFRGGLLLSGPIIRDTAQFVLGVDAQRLETVLPAAWEASPGDTALLGAADSLGVDLTAYRQPRLATLQTVSGFGRFDWQATRSNRLSVVAFGSWLDGEDPPFGRGAVGLGSTRTGYDIAAGAHLTSVLGSVATLEVRAGFETGRREFLDNDTALTVIADGPASWGTDPTLPGRFDRTGFRVGEALHLKFGQQRMKLGGSLDYDSHRDIYAFNRTGTFVYGGGADLLALDGGFAQTAGVEPIAKLSALQYGFFAQDRWEFAPGADLVMGMRVDWEGLGRNAFIRNSALAELVGIETDVRDYKRTKYSPRLGFVWDVANQHRWVVQLDGGIYHGSVASHAAAEAAAQATGVLGRSGTGGVGGWPSAPDLAVVPVQGTVVSVLPIFFSAPRSQRASMGLTGSLGGGTRLHVSGVYRHTDFLVRRRDLNRIPGVVAFDQYERPVYGELEQHGSAVLATPGSNRRLGTFAAIHALNQDGVSDYRGITARLQQRMSQRVKLSFGYTYSRTTDNVPGMARGVDAQLSPFPDSLTGVDWDDGRSDFDIPHRAAFGAAVDLRVARVAGFYRYESGLPFTPGFRDGVDANGDGSWRNDPAYVDDAVAGVTDLFGAWDCLRTQVGRFAERNSCRGPARKSLDLRLSLGPFRLGYPLEIVLDAINVLDAENADVDRALYLVDRTGTLARAAAAGTVTVPLVANPDFGRAIRRYGSGRYLRIGLRVNYE